MKQCTKCNEWKADEEYSFYNKSEGKRRAQCKECVRQYQQSPEYKEYMRQYKQSPEYKERMRQRRQSPEYKEYMRQYKQSPKRKEYMRQYEQSPKYKERRRQANQRHRARKRELIHTLTVAEWRGILEKWGHACAYTRCGGITMEEHLQRYGQQLHQDHVIPQSRYSGSYSIHNIVPACRDCNSFKGDRTPLEAGMTLRVIDQKEQAA